MMLNTGAVKKGEIITDKMPYKSNVLYFFWFDVDSNEQKLIETHLSWKVLFKHVLLFTGKES